MADISAFPTIRNVLVEGNNIVTFVSAGTITAGMVVAFATTGVSMSVNPAVKGTTGQPIGVALNSAVSGGSVAVAMDGCVVYVANAETDGDIDAGDILEDNDNTVGGTVSTVSVMDAGVYLVLKYQVGIALDIILRSTTGRMLVQCGRFTAANNA